MALEPAVEKSIREHRLRSMWHHVIPIVPLVAVLALCVVLLVLGFTRNGGAITRLPGDPSIRSFRLFPIVILTILPFIYLVPAYIKWVRPANNQFKRITREAENYDRVSYNRFRRGLESVSVGMGTSPPALVVLDFPGANTISFRLNSPAIGVTREALQADLTQHEIESIMAHELTHLMGGDELRSPNSFRGFSGAILVAVVLLPILSYWIAPRGFASAPYLLMVYLVPFISMFAVPFSMWLKTRPYSISSINRYYFHKDILADSVSARLTKHPKAMKSAIEKMVDLMYQSEEVPNETIAFTQMFVGPLKEWQTDIENYVPGTLSTILNSMGQVAASQYDVSRNPGGTWERLFTGYGERYPTAEQRRAAIEQSMDVQMRGFIWWEKKLVNARIDNLDRVERNYWEAFEIRDGRPVLHPDKWYT